jgi:hypothetical protein
MNLWGCGSIEKLCCKNHMCIMVHVQVDYTSHVQIIIQMILCNQLVILKPNFGTWKEELILYVFETNNDNVELKEMYIDNNIKKTTSRML